MRTPLLLALLLLPSSAIAQVTGGPPWAFSAGTTDNMQRPGVPGQCHRARANTTQRPVALNNRAVNAGSSNGLACFAWGGVLRIGCEQNVRAAVVMSSTVTLGGSLDPYQLIDPEGVVGSSIIGPPNGSAEQATFIQAGTWTHFTMAASPWSSRLTPTMRIRRCAGLPATDGFPCNADNDCGVGGTCSIIETPRCAFLLLEADTAAGNCTVCEER